MNYKIRGGASAYAGPPHQSVPPPGLFQDSNFVRFTFLIFSNFVFTRSRTARPGRNQNSPPLSQFALRANLTGVGVVFLHRPTTHFIPPFPTPIPSLLPAVTRGSPPISLLCDNRFPPTRPFKHRACRPRNSRTFCENPWYFVNVISGEDKNAVGFFSA